MEREFKHPQTFADVLTLSQIYYPMHNNLPKPFRFSVGEQILKELAFCLRHIVLANAVDKMNSIGCRQGAEYIRQVRASVEVMKGFFLLAWRLKYVSHGALTELSSRFEAISTQSARWQQWFVARCIHSA